jgi:SOS-response transcriptional repressor LexA
MPVATTHRAKLSLIRLEIPGKEPVAAGVLLLDPSTDKLYVRFRRDWDQVAPEEAAVLDLIEADIQAKSIEFGGASLVAHLEDALSNVVTISDAREVIVEDFARALGRLYRENVQTNIQPHKTHIPRYSLAVAAGKFLENQEVTEEGWEEAPPGLRVTPDMFVARIQGRSMEPLIPDGSLCVFRRGVVGSRQGKLVLVEAMGRGTNDRYTVKRYRSEKSEAEDGTWTHESIKLEALNPEFESWFLDPQEDRYRILAEFVRLMD